MYLSSAQVAYCYEKLSVDNLHGEPYDFQIIHDFHCLLKLNNHSKSKIEKDSGNMCGPLSTGLFVQREMSHLFPFLWVIFSHRKTLKAVAFHFGVGKDCENLMKTMGLISRKNMFMK